MPQCTSAMPVPQLAHRAAVSGAQALTPSERRVANLAAQGVTNKQIAQTLYVTVKTIEKHLANAYLKLDVNSRHQLPEALENTQARSSPAAAG